MAGRHVAFLALLVEGVKHPIKNVATIVLPDGQVLADADTYATVVDSDGSEHGEIEHRKHHGYGVVTASHSQVGDAPDATTGDAKKIDQTGAPTGTEQADGEKLTPEELRGCVDTEGWTNGFTDPEPQLVEFWMEAQVEFKNAGHNGVLLHTQHGQTCAVYTFMGICMNLKWIEEEAEDFPCAFDRELMGGKWNHPEENCCACGKGHPKQGFECSDKTKIEIAKHREGMIERIDIAFEGSPADKRQHDIAAGEGKGSSATVLSLLVMLFMQ